ncbi:GntR family transcriptional regulator [Bacillus sp. D386]|uniref:GntR family transcriptional regulator n=1 Tax=Bacillus sp. D386 TaxID=2587155 RepID=UPI0015D589D4|nr:GntR family transcriptional regulator [Bacillus sp. D386]
MDSPLMDNRRLSTKDFVYQEIKKQIILSELKPLQPINEIKTASDLGISRTPLREALQRLEIEELIIRQPNGRLKVAPISIQEAKEIYNIRGLLEGLIAKEAAIKVNEDEIQKLQLYTNLLNEAALTDRREYVVNYGSEIHSLLYKISGNHTAVKILRNMNDKISRYRRLGPKDSMTRSMEAAFEHKRLTEAIAERNPTKAESLMKQHIHNSLAAALKSITSHINEYE